MQVHQMANEHGHNSRRTLFDLPVELIEEIYMLALSSTFPQTCKRIHSTVKSFSPFTHAYYILGRHPVKMDIWDEPTLQVSSTLSSALRYPITTLAVLEALYRIILRSNSTILTYPDIELPKRFFCSLENDTTRDVNSDPLPILRFLWGEDGSNYKFPKPTACSHGGYPLVRAVHAEFIPLIMFLLDHGAEPGWRHCLAVRVAIGKKDLKLVKMLIDNEKPNRRIGRNRVSVMGNDYLLDVAVKCNARDIVKYFMEEKKCVPRIRTLRSRRIAGPS